MNEAIRKGRGPLLVALGVAVGVVLGVALAVVLGWSPGAEDDAVPRIGSSAAGAVEVSPPEPSSAEGRTEGSPLGAPASFAELAEAVAPAVVTIHSVSYSGGEARGGLRPFFDFFHPGEEDDGEDSAVERRQVAGGSGFVVRADGLVVTNHHVVEDASELTVTLADGREVPAVIRGSDPETDIALLQLEIDSELPFLALGQMQDLRVGDWVMVIGNPLRLGRTVTVGVVSATGRTLGIMEPSFENFVQTDAAINFGNSGGPMVDLQGRVVGVATAIDWGAENIGFAVPVSTLRNVLPQLETEGRVRRGYLGVEIEDVDFESRRAFQLDSEEGVLVLDVVPETPAARAGLRHGDVIRRIDDRPVESTRSLIEYVATRKPGTEIALELIREGRVVERRVRLAERPHSQETSRRPGSPSVPGIEWLGLGYRDLTPALRDAHGIPSDVEGVWIQDVDPRSPLVEERIRPGDLVVEVEGEPVTDTSSFESAIRGAPSGSTLRLYVRRFDPRTGRASGFFAFVEKP